MMMVVLCWKPLGILKGQTTTKNLWNTGCFTIISISWAISVFFQRILKKKKGPILVAGSNSPPEND